MGGINSLSGLNSVPVDYRPQIASTAQNAQAANVNAQPQPEPDAQEPPNAPRAANVLQQLDVLLLGGAAKSVASSAAMRAKTVGEVLVQNGVITEKEAAELQELAKKASNTLKALDKFTGAELAKALMPDGKTGELVWRKGFFFMNSTAKAVKAAVEAQQALSEGLAKFNDRFGKMDEKLQDAFVEMQFQADRRSTEIYSVVLRMYDLALQDAAQVGRDAPIAPHGDPQVKKLLSATFSELMPREAILMHGTAEAIEKHLGDTLRPFAEKLDALRANSGKILANEDILALEGEMKTMKAALDNVRKNGIEVNGGRLEVDKSLLAAMERVLHEAAEKIAAARKEMADKAVSEFIGEVVKSLSLDGNPEEKALAGSLELNNSLIREFALARINLEKVLAGIANGTIKRDQADAQIDAALKRLGNTSLSQDILERLGFGTATAKALADRLDSLRIVKAQFKEMLRRAEEFAAGEGGATAGSDVLRIFLGEKSISSVIDAKVRGFKPEDVDSATDDANVVSSKTLASGAAGTTYLLVMKDGKEYVFKPELEGRLGLDQLAIAQGGAFGDAQTTAKLNLATQDTAKLLGCEDVIVKYTVGNHDGKFGIFMEKAKGATGAQFVDKKDAGGDDSVKPSELGKELRDNAENARIRGETARKLCQLQWLDIVTGQMDRHWNNYFINIDKTTHKVSVKGIDCDASFPAYRTGLQKYALDKNVAKSFFDSLLAVCKELHPDKQGKNEFEKRAKNDPAIVRNQDGSITVDLTKAQTPEIAMALRNVLGAQSFALPNVIDETTYQKLMELDADPAKKQAYLDSLAGRIPQAALEATRMRLDEAIAHAKKLQTKGNVFSDNDWNSPRRLGQLGRIETMVEIPTVTGQKLLIDKFQSPLVEEYGIQMCPSYYRRDYIGSILPK